MDTIKADTLDLNAMHLKKGAHGAREQGCCALELVAWMANEPHSDHPSCTCPVLADFVRNWNDALEDEPRQLLKPYLPRMIGTVDDGAQEPRAWMIIDWSLREAFPLLLDMLKLNENAGHLRALPAIVDRAALTGAQTKIASAIEAARSVSAAVYYPLALALDLALALALDRARALALALDRARALALALDLARDLALAPAEVAAIKGKRKLLEESALQLIERMIDAGKEPVAA